MPPIPLDFDVLVTELNAFKHCGLQVELSVERETPEIVHVLGRVVNVTGNEVGRGISRTFVFRDGEGWEVRHRVLYLDDDVQGRGFGRAFEQHSIGVYQRHGVLRVSLSAERIGSYAWRNLGYQLPREPSVRRNQSVEIWTNHGGRDRAHEAVAAGRVQRQRVDEIEELFLAIARDEREPLEPHEIGQLASDVTWMENGRVMWLGRAILTNAKWTGIKQL